MGCKSIRLLPAQFSYKNFAVEEYPTFPAFLPCKLGKKNFDTNTRDCPLDGYTDY